MSGTIKDVGSQAFVSRIGTDREALGQRFQPERVGVQFPSASARNAANQKTYQGTHCFNNPRVLVFAAAALLSCADKIQATCVSSDFDETSRSGAFEGPQLARHAIVGPARPETATATHSIGRYPVQSSENSGWYGYWNPGSYIDSGRYYCLDSYRYIYFDISRYNLLGLKGYVLEQSCHPTWYEYGSHWLALNLEREIRLPGKIHIEWVDVLAMTQLFREATHENNTPDAPPHTFAAHSTSPFARDRYHEWPTYSTPGSYIDRARYYCLDETQYHYLENDQYNLLGGLSYLFGQAHHRIRHIHGSFGRATGGMVPIPEPSGVILWAIGTLGTWARIGLQNERRTKKHDRNHGASLALAS